MRIAVDWHPNFSQHGEWIRDGGSRLAIPDFHAATIEVGVFREGVWSTPTSANIFIEFKDGETVPNANTSTLASSSAAPGAATRAEWEAGTNQHASISFTGIQMTTVAAGITGETAWMIVSIVDGSLAVPVASGRVLIVS